MARSDDQINAKSPLHDHCHIPGHEDAGMMGQYTCI
jgi:uncharacterized cupredoxin-like copper-binding protein